MKERQWKSGNPPHIGWWNASKDKDARAWRWWDGVQWSGVTFAGLAAAYARQSALQMDHGPADSISWSDYYPEGARVPRMDPADPKNKFIVTCINGSLGAKTNMFADAAWKAYVRKAELDVLLASKDTPTVREMKKHMTQPVITDGKTIDFSFLPQVKMLREFPGYEHLSATDKAAVDVAQQAEAWRPKYVHSSNQRLSESVRKDDASFQGAMQRNTLKCPTQWRKGDVVGHDKAGLRGKTSTGQTQVPQPVRQSPNLMDVSARELLQELLRRFG